MPAERRVVTEEPLNASTPLEALRHDVTPTPLHFVRSHFPVPEVTDAEGWQLRVDGNVTRPYSVTLKELKRDFDAVTLACTMECAGNGRTRMRPIPPGTPWDDGAVSTATFTGAPLRDVLSRAGLRGKSVEALFVGADRGRAGGADISFERSLPVQDALRGDVILAWDMNGEPLPPEHGFPLRVLVPGWYGVASVKWLTRVTLLTDPFDGFFQREHYTYQSSASEAAGKPVTRTRVKSLLHAPLDGARVAVGAPVEVAGRAWSGAGGVTRVEVSVDGGASWREAELDAPLGPYAWRGFRLAWTPDAPGERVLLARATDGARNTQPLEPPTNRLGYGNNAAVPTRVVVE